MSTAAAPGCRHGRSTVPGGASDQKAPRRSGGTTLYLRMLPRDSSFGLSEVRAKRRTENAQVGFEAKADIMLLAPSAVVAGGRENGKQKASWSPYDNNGG